ncbi:cytochrome P450 [Aquirufa ecclesiirivi]|uniref:cytochrome P450 n=1 Tax=Aquirufa ecclesiirivi TaxID=2715124 RepID=UPI0022A8A18F|nr:cytochrome P450 [Aquirufa ecclesiirivi]MCZ2473349.1 cytochrome P450 [Aquirufa ecclesiirivi]
MVGESTIKWNPFAPDYFNDPYPIYTLSRQSNPIQKDQFGNIILFKYRDVAPILDSPDFEVSSLSSYFESKKDYIFQNTAQCPFLAKTTSKWLMYLNGDIHRKLRIAIGKILFSYDFDRLIQEAVQDCISHFEDYEELDIVDFSKYFIYHILKQFIGLKDFASLENVFEFSNMAARSQDLFVSKQMYLKMNDCFLRGKGLFAEGDFKAKLINELDGFEFEEDDYYSILAITLMAFFETSKDNLTVSLYTILSSPSLSDYVLNANKKEIKLLTEECIRYTSPLQFTIRINIKEVDIQGTLFPAGTRFILGLASANRDEEVFESPSEIKPNRTVNPHIAFGKGVHICLGALIARKEMEFGLKPMVAFLQNFNINTMQPLRWGNQIFMRTLESAMLKRN